MKKHLLTIAAATTVFAATTQAAVFNSVTDGDWSNPATWGETIATPGANDTVSVGHNIALSSSTASLNSLTMTAGSLTASGWSTSIIANTIDLQAGNLTHALNSDTASPWVPTNRVYIQAGTLTVGGSASINTNALGYQGGLVQQTWTEWSDGNRYPGMGNGGGNPYPDWGNAGSYGGMGGGSAGSGGVYGSFFSPEDPGSGGGSGQTGLRGNGGGTIWIVVSDSMTLNGTISAVGGIASGHSGAGSGGSVLIETLSLAGNGVISADGGHNSNSFRGGAGGGGRVAVSAGASSFSGAITSAAGVQGASNPSPIPMPGTLYSVLGEPTPGAIGTTSDGTPQLDTLLSVTSGTNGAQLLRDISQWDIYRMIWTDDSQDMLGTSLSNNATYTISGLAPNYPYYQVFVDGVNIYGGFITSSPTGTIDAFSVTLGSEHSIMIAVPEPTTAGLLVLAALVGLRRRR